MSDDKQRTVEIQLLFVDEGRYHSEDVELPEAILQGHERLIDCLLEEPEVLMRLHVDPQRLCAAYRKD